MKFFEKHYRILDSLEVAGSHAEYAQACLNENIEPYSFDGFVQMFAWLFLLKSTHPAMAYAELAAKYAQLKPSVVIYEFAPGDPDIDVSQFPPPPPSPGAEPCGNCGGGTVL